MLIQFFFCINKQIYNQKNPHSHPLSEIFLLSGLSVNGHSYDWLTSLHRTEVLSGAATDRSEDCQWCSHVTCLECKRDRTDNLWRNFTVLYDLSVNRHQYNKMMHENESVSSLSEFDLYIDSSC